MTAASSDHEHVWMQYGSGGGTADAEILWSTYEECWCGAMRDVPQCPGCGNLHPASCCPRLEAAERQKRGNMSQRGDERQRQKKAARAGRRAALRREQRKQQLLRS